MKCENCGRQVGPEELKCPHCGADNLFALLHQQNMEEFGETFHQTEQDVAASAKKISKIGIKAVVLMALLIGCVVLSMISSANYKDPDPDEAVRKDAVKHAEEYSAQIDGFLKNGEYMECVDFMYAHEIMNISADEYDHLRNIKYVLHDYENCIQEMEEMVFRSTDPDYFDSLDTAISSFCRSLDSFYETWNGYVRTKEKNADYKAYMEDMEQELKLAMKLYFSLDDEELAAFMELTQGQKAVKIEEVIRDEK